MSKTEDLMEKLQELQSEYEKAAEKIGEKAFSEMTAKLFKACPKLGRIVWMQYAPHFNDGDACTFAVCGPIFFEAVEKPAHMSDDEWEDKQSEDEDYENNMLSTYNARYEGAEELRAFEKFLTSTLGEDLCERVFGDGYKVRISRGGGLDVSEYEHD